jgi:hypothetical protein
MTTQILNKVIYCMNIKIVLKQKNDEMLIQTSIWKA